VEGHFYFFPDGLILPALFSFVIADLLFFFFLRGWGDFKFSFEFN